ncbi:MULTISPECIES: GNAT family N-acetyltransferase [Paenibacillus]|uniref:GNAT family N-acetyltransferase n=1 Tax=Paenibacillus TaxID=44249 RepID=UPI002FE0C6DC
MDGQVEIYSVESLDAMQRRQLSELLISVVADGASVGFLAPLGFEEAADYWDQALEPGVLLWVAASGGMILGTVQLHLAAKANGAHRAEVAKLMVHPDFRKKGIGRLLMARLEQAAVEKQRSLLILDTREGDPSNLLYQSLGYREAGRIPGYARSTDGRLEATIYYYKEL